MESYEIPEGMIYFTQNIEDLPLLGFKCKIGDLYHGMDLEEYAKFRSVSLTVDAAQHADADQRPAIARLEDTAGAFLAGEAGTSWAEAVHNAQVNNDAFAVIGVDKLRYLENFNSGAELPHRLVRQLSEWKTRKRNSVLQFGNTVAIIEVGFV